MQLLFALDEESEPEPDLAVVAGTLSGRLPAGAPRSAPAALVEVTETTLAFARHSKGSLYARAGHRRVLDRERGGGALEVYRNRPRIGRRVTATHGDTQILRAGDIVVPLAAPGAEISVAELLP